jgi:pyruvate kinase
VRELRRGDTILLADGAVELRTQKTSGDAVITKVVSGGYVTSRKGLNIPGRALSIPAFRPKDKADLEFALKHDADFIAMSFVRSADDIRAVQRAMKRAGKTRPVIAKIEKPQALDDIDNIIDAADGIMVARGDLGVELSVERVPGAQKTIIEKCAAARTWVIVATQMLESMIEHATPTRAEASDVANAVYDGTDCVMLSGETAIGRHPDKAVRMMARICHAAEAGPRRDTHHSLYTAAPASGKKVAANRCDISCAVVDAALILLKESVATALWVFTESGRTARLVSKLRPRKPVYAFSPHQSTLRYLSGMWGIHPLQVAQVKTTDEMVAAGEEAACRHRCGRPGDRVVVLAGQAPTVGATDLIKIHVIR